MSLKENANVQTFICTQMRIAFQCRQFCGWKSIDTIVCVMACVYVLCMITRYKHIIIKLTFFGANTMKVNIEVAE
jgi:hypothetical protein